MQTAGSDIKGEPPRQLNSLECCHNLFCEIFAGILQWYVLWPYSQYMYSTGQKKRLN